MRKKLLIKETEYTNKSQSKIEKNRKKLENLGYRNLQPLAQGNYGTAFTYVDSGITKIIKETTDKAEAKTSAQLIDKKLTNVINIYRVFKFQSLSWIYFIDQEYLHQKDIQVAEDTIQEYLDIEISISGETYRTEEVAENFLQKIIFDLIRKNKLEIELRNNEEYNSNKKYKAFLDDILNGLKELKSNGIRFWDINNSNILYDSQTKHYKLIDIGLSRSPAAAKQNISVYEVLSRKDEL